VAADSGIPPGCFSIAVGPERLRSSLGLTRQTQPKALQWSSDHQLSNPDVRVGKCNRVLVLLTILLIALIVAVLVAWRLLRPDFSAASAGALTEHDKKQIAAMCRQYTIQFALDKLRNGDVGWFGHSTRVLFQQRIHRFIDDHDGTYRIYVVVYDKREPDGFYAWSRHQVAKTKGQWTILRSY